MAKKGQKKLKRKQSEDKTQKESNETNVVVLDSVRYSDEPVVKKVSKTQTNR